MTAPQPDPPPDPPAPRRTVDPVNIGCNVLFGLLLLIPAGALLAAGLMAVASLPLMVALFPTAITLGSLALLVLYIRHRRARRGRNPGGR
ncbi:hypothetical protein F1188_14465 [Roseospira marina]|uniref:Uncharacterized protein n=1 Tax=Roseospira marina TaxID=140057 RepID=A0A5M6IAR3_9PROT|nr:hypothetical protein [Roseospira marina]KAA5604809.1 hypothetical protein F1188_14465 [Roseospira marina]MBB4313500.1 Flp pilus assembly protein TadB [Roseospira marina]MBB5086662.1 Flp pilus assembly protein TadB [Roseospira marina]